MRRVLRRLCGEDANYGDSLGNVRSNEHIQRGGQARAREGKFSQRAHARELGIGGDACACWQRDERICLCLGGTPALCWGIARSIAILEMLTVCSRCSPRIAYRALKSSQNVWLRHSRGTRAHFLSLFEAYLLKKRHLKSASRRFESNLTPHMNFCTRSQLCDI